MTRRQIGVCAFYTFVLLAHGVAAQDVSPLAQAEVEERAIAKEIIANGPGTRAVVPGVAAGSYPASAVTISEKLPGFWSMKTELPSDQIWQQNGRSAIFGNGSIHRFSGEVRFDSPDLPVFAGDGDEGNRLAFVLVSEVGYVYLRGRGRLTYADGRVIELGKAESGDLAR